MKMIVKRGSGDRFAYTPQLAARDDVDVIEVELEHDKDGQPLVSEEGHFVLKDSKPVPRVVVKNKAPADTRVHVEIED